MIYILILGYGYPTQQSQLQNPSKKPNASKIEIEKFEKDYEVQEKIGE